ncbi:hypothetical protein RJT34_07060 [Clitoria ternatea]|uniref:Uncharacterized protein n=1 Tax=Clitoria ternatea TaxID=43366 RepID=A0AAN9K325_CLITE
MMLIKNVACVMFVLLCTAWLSTARLNPTGAEATEILDIKATSITTTTTKTTMVKSQAAIDERKLNKPNAKIHVSKSVEGKRNVRSRLSDDVKEGLVAFTADYHRPVHHPPKNNK